MGALRGDVTLEGRGCGFLTSGEVNKEQDFASVISSAVPHRIWISVNEIQRTTFCQRARTQKVWGKAVVELVASYKFIHNFNNVKSSCFRFS